MSEEQSERTAGYAAAKRWLGELASESERANLVAVFESGLFEVILAKTTYPTLAEALGAAEGSRLVDFAANDFLVGFRWAVIEEVAGEGD